MMGKIIRVGLIVVALLLTGQATMQAVRAAPIAFVEPAAGPPGTTFAINVSGLPAYARLTCRVSGPDGRLIGLGPCMGEANGRGGLVTPFITGEGYIAGGTYTVNFYDEAGAFVIATTFDVVLPEQRCFAETGQCMQGRFLRYWYARGALPFYGYPLSGEFMERLDDGREYRVQYFERVRMEYHPENNPPFDVLLGQFGRSIHPADPPVPQKANGLYFPQTGHNVEGAFLNFLDSFNEVGLGVEYFGYPISEAFTERLEDGNSYTVQYFERARLEVHPEIGSNQILLGQFGRRILLTRYPSGPPSGAVPTPSPAPAFNPQPYLGQGDKYNCTDFANQAQAQAVLRADPRDPNVLDANRDGIACEGNPAPRDLVRVPR